MEIWKDVVGFEGFYQISNHGRLRRSGNFNTASKPNKCLAQVETSDGYVGYRLSANSRQKSVRAHQLVAEAFLGPRPTDRHIVAHNDGDKKNNNVENLRWATPAENSFDQVAHGTKKGRHFGRTSVFTDEEIYAIRADTRPNYILAEEYSVSRATIHHIRKRISHKHLPERHGDFKVGEDKRVFFTPEQILQIRDDNRSSYVIAEEFGVNATTIQKIRKLETYSWVSDESSSRKRSGSENEKASKPINFAFVDEGTMKVIFRNGTECIFDSEDYEKLKEYRWRLIRGRTNLYAGAETYGSETKRVLMHRLVMNCPEDMVVDHINGDGLDNRKENLRVATRSQNSKNRKVNSNNTSGYKGVTFDQTSGSYRASIMCDYEIIHLGLFSTAEEAAQAYADASAKYHGEYGRTHLDD